MEPFRTSWKIETGTQIQFFCKDRHRALGPRERFWKNMKKQWTTIRKPIFFYGPKPLESNEKQILFLILGHSKKPMKKRSKKGFQKSFKIGWKRPWGRQASIYSSILSIWAPVEKNMFFRSATKRPKIIKNRSKCAQGPPDGLTRFSEPATTGSRVPRPGTIIKEID